MKLYAETSSCPGGDFRGDCVCGCLFNLPIYNASAAFDSSRVRTHSRFSFPTAEGIVGPIATNQSLRMGQILLAIPVGVYCVAAFLAAWSVTARYAPWVFLVGVLLFFGVSRPDIKRLPHALRARESGAIDLGELDERGD